METHETMKEGDTGVTAPTLHSRQLPLHTESNEFSKPQQP